MRVFCAVFVALLCVLPPTVAQARTRAAMASVCRVNWSHGLPGPDNSKRCTPGTFDRISKANVCDGDSPHPTLHAADRREIVGEYGVPDWSGLNGELDHRVPVFLGGRTEPENIWPEPGKSSNNEKDALERRAYRRICFHDPLGMRVRTGRRLFLADWRTTYRAWKEDGIL